MNLFKRSGKKSKPSPTPLPRNLTQTSWRAEEGWDKSVREELREHVASLAPNDTNKVPFINILLTGQKEGGRSSLINSINSVFSNRIIADKAVAGEAAQIFDKEFRIHEIKLHGKDVPLRWRIMDTLAINNETGEIDIRNILKAVDGHVPDRNKFTSGVDFHRGCTGYVASPTLAQQAHCVVVGVNACHASEMDDYIWRHLCSLRQSLIARDVPMFILLTHIDEACPAIRKDLTKVYQSMKIRDLVSTVKKELKDFPDDMIFPVKNYSKELEMKDEIDILLLCSLREMLHSAQDYIKSKCRVPVRVPVKKTSKPQADVLKKSMDLL